MKKRRLIIILIALIIAAAGAVGWTVLNNRSIAPVIESIENGQNGVNIVWQRNRSAKSYMLYRKTDNKYELVSQFSADETSYCDENVKSGKTYTYSLKIKHRIGESAEASASIDYLSCPVLKSVSNQISCVYVKWSECGGAEKYTVYKKTGKGSYNAVATVSDTYYIDLQIRSGVKATYYVVAENENIKSHISEKKSTVFIDAPLISGISNGDGYALVKWNRVENAGGYLVYRRSSGKSKWERIGKTDEKSLSFVDRKAPAYKSCLYTVKAYNASSVSGYYSSGKRNVYIAPVNIKSVRYSSGNIYFRWSGSSKCSGYRVYRKTGVGKFRLVASLGEKVTSYAERKTKKNTRYEYAVSACLGGFASAKAYTGSVSFSDAKKPMLALTFDDGPNDEVTQSILKTLKKYEARATFFVVGERAQWDSSAACIKKAYAMGCEIGNHTYGHQILTESSADIRGELSQTSDIVKKITGSGTELMRPPGGAFDKRVQKQCPYPMIMWSVDTRDWESRNSASVLKKIKSGAEDGAVILMHDLYPSTAKAVQKAVPWLVKKGYQLVTVSELMQAKGIGSKAGSVVYCG